MDNAVKKINSVPLQPLRKPRRRWNEEKCVPLYIATGLGIVAWLAVMAICCPK
ncbi:MAG: hypothetical protein WC364_12905 [Eubacteriales bacterium]